jgi:hypothetical protein
MYGPGLIDNVAWKDLTVKKIILKKWNLPCDVTVPHQKPVFGLVDYTTIKF